MVADIVVFVATMRPGVGSDVLQAKTGSRVMKTLLIPAVHIAVLFAVIPPVTDAQWVRVWPDSSAASEQTWDVSQVVECLASSGGVLFAGSDYWTGYLRSTDDGVTWIRLDPLGTFVGTWGVSGSSLFQGSLAGSLGKVHRSTDAGKSWTEADNGLRDAWVEGFGFDGTSLFAGTGWNGIFRTTNGGSSWTQLADSTLGASLQRFAVSGTNVFVSGSEGIFHSKDGGMNWTNISSGLPFSGRYSLLAANGPALFAEGNGLMRSTDSGANWTPVFSGSFSIWTILVSNSTVFAGTSAGIFWSSDNGTTWRGGTNGLPTIWEGTITGLAVSGQNLVATTWCGIYRTKLSYITGVRTSSSSIPETVELGQNFPNPFNPTTTIRYALPERSHVNLTVFNTLGQQVSALVNEIQDAGHHDVRFDGSGLASGVYFYRLQAGDFVQSKKLIVLR
jgi:hypothetical protein